MRFDDYFSGLVDFPGRDVFEYSVDDDGKVLRAIGVFIGDVMEAREIPPLETSQDETYRRVRNTEILQEFEQSLKNDRLFVGCMEQSPDENPQFSHTCSKVTASRGHGKMTWQDMMHCLKEGNPLSRQLKRKATMQRL